MGIAEKTLHSELALQMGDILISEMPYQDAEEEDIFPFKSLKKFEAGHSALWVAGDRPIAHSVQEGYKFPGVRLTQLPESRCVVFRLNDSALASRAGEILKNWALSSRFYTLSDYLSTYPAAFWRGRHERDLKNFYANKSAVVPGPATPYIEPRATHDIFDLMRNPKVSQMGMEGLRRAIKFASRANLSSPNPISKGQRCTAVLVAAIQAAILEPIVKKATEKTSFKRYKGKNVLDYADEVLIDGWRETLLGRTLLEAVERNDFSLVFPAAFMMDQRYATPIMLYDMLRDDPTVRRVGRFAYLKEKIEVIPESQLSRSFELERDTPSPGARRLE